MVAVVMLALSGSLAGMGSASAMNPMVATDDPPVDPPVDPPPPTDQAAFADPSATPVKLTRGGSSVTVSRTAGLTRQAVQVSWTGMQPSSLQVLPPTNPVLVMQCRGTNPDRSDCWILDSQGVNANFYQPNETTDWWTARLEDSIFGRPLEIPFREQVNKDPKKDVYHAKKLEDGSGWLVPQLDDRTIAGLPPLDDRTPATSNERFGLTQANGNGQIDTWINTGFENPSLGCSDKAPCSLVVIPVHAHPCQKNIPELFGASVCADLDLGGQSAQIQNWQLLANWYERYVFKLSFTPRVASCNQRNDKVSFTGSELAGEAMRSWVAARCQPSSPVAMDYTRKWEPEVRTQQGQRDPIQPSGYGLDAALTTEPAEADSPTADNRKPGYAPVAVSGFAIGFRWNLGPLSSDVGKPIPGLKLNARLVAKLLTQSYAGRYRLGAANNPPNPNVSTNPESMSTDPEFLQLNPDAATWTKLDLESLQLAVPIANTDVMLALSRWMLADPSARAFLQGKTDPWGMTVNKQYRGWQLPTDSYELRDGWTIPKAAKADGGWPGFSPPQLGAATPNSWAESADSALSSWPLSQHPVTSLQGNIQPKRVEPLPAPGRVVLALSTTSELAKLGIPAAALQNSGGDFVEPNVDSMTYALDGATVNKDSGTWNLSYATMDKRGYPGTMITYAAVPTATLKGDAPRQYADTLRWMTTDGQGYGPEAGQLPDGYLSLTDPMRAQAAKVADAVENQTGTPPIPPSDPVDGPKDPTPNDPTTSGPTGQNQNNGNNQNGNQPTNNPTTNAPTTQPTTPAGPSTVPSQKPQAQGSIKPVSATTQGDSLGWLAWGIPALLIAGLVAGVASPGIRVIATPGHPVRRGFASGASYLASLLRRGRRRNG
jgi:hypothetical protein